MSNRSPLAAILVALAAACSRSDAPTTTPSPLPSAAESRMALAAGSVAADGVTPAEVTVVVRDVSGVPIPGVPVTISYAGNALAAQPTLVTDASGVATFLLTASAPTSGAVTASVASETPVVLEAPAQLAFHGCTGIFVSGACIPPPWLSLSPARPANVVLSEGNEVATGDLDGNGCEDVVVASRDVATVELHLSLCDGRFAPPVLHDLLGHETGEVFGVVVADLDGDAVLDVATELNDRLTGTSGLRVLLGRGDGTLAPASAFGVFGEPFGAADVDADGDLELLTKWADEVRVVLNDGHGAFSAGAEVPTGAPTGSAWIPGVGDLDADGRADLVVAFKGTGSVAVLRGLGDGTFASPVAVDDGAMTALALADFDGDGRLDVLTAHANGLDPGALHLLRGNGDGTLAAPVSFACASSPLALEAADVDGDRVADAVVVSGENTISVHRSNADGTFAPPIAYEVPVTPFSQLALANLDRDGRADAVMVSGTLRTLRALGAGRLGGTPTLRPDCYGDGGVATGDVNGDGVLDLACGDGLGNGAGVVFVALGAGDGIFLPPVPYASGPNPSYVAIADLDRDGYGDVVAANRGSNDVTTLLGGPDGVLVRAGAFPVHESPAAMAVADFDGDELPDAVVVSAFTTTVTLLRGVGDGTFTVEALSAAFKPYDVALGDLDGDLDPDLALVRPRPPAVVVLENVGGSFSGAVWSPAGPAADGWTSGVALADLDGDGKLDAVATDSELDRVQVLLGGGDRSFAAPVAYDVGAWPRSTAVGDVNGDGNVDVVTGDGESETVTVLVGNGDGTLASGSLLAVGGQPLGGAPRSVAVADFDVDGADDIVVGTGGKLRFYPGGPDGPSGAAPVAAGSSPSSVAAGDLDGDGALDLVALCDSPYGGLSVAMGTGGGSFGPSAMIATELYGQAVALADLDGDGALDVVTSHANPGLAVGTIGVLLGNGDGTFQPQATYAAGSGAYRFVVADVNGDGELDVLLARGAYLAGDGAGALGPLVPITGLMGDDIAAADLNGDGKLDVVTAFGSEHQVATFVGNGAGAFQAKSTRTVNYPSRLVVSDLDGDGKLDVAAVGSSLAFLRGAGDGTVAPPVLGAAIPGWSLVSADLDLDGRPDLVTGSRYGSDTLVVHRNEGGGTFAASAWEVGLSPIDLAAADLDGDGRPDVALLTESGVFPLLARVP